MKRAWLALLREEAYIKRRHVVPAAARGGLTSTNGGGLSRPLSRSARGRRFIIPGAAYAAPETAVGGESPRFRRMLSSESGWVATGLVTAFFDPETDLVFNRKTVSGRGYEL